VATGQETAWVVTEGGDKNSKKVFDGSQPGSDLDEDDLIVFPQPLLLSNAQPLTLMADRSASGEEGIHCSVKIYDATGRLVAKAFEGRLEAGRAVVLGESAKGGVPKAPGVYFLCVETRTGTVTRRIVVLK
jgi:hypothetical protein